MILLAHNFSGEKNIFLSVYGSQNMNMVIYNSQSRVKNINHQILHRAIASAVYSYVWHCTNSRNATDISDIYNYYYSYNYLFFTNYTYPYNIFCENHLCIV